MSKKSEHYDEAEQMYVTQHLSFNAIATRLKIAEKTVRNWAEGGDWHAKRKSLNQKRQSLNEMMYDSAYLIMESIKRDLAEGKPVDAFQLNSVKGMIAMLEKSRTFEQSTGKEEVVTPEKARATEEGLQEVRRSLGIM